MSDRGLKISLAIGAMFLFAHSSVAHETSQGTGTKYQVVKVCPLLSLAEVKKLAPWEPHLDQFATPEEEAIGIIGSSCNYPSVFIQVMAFQRSFIDNLRKTGTHLEPVSGVGEEAYVRNNRGNFAELIAKVGPHSLTVQLSIERDQSFESTKTSLIAIGQAYADRLR